MPSSAAARRRHCKFLFGFGLLPALLIVAQKFRALKDDTLLWLARLSAGQCTVRRNAPLRDAPQPRHAGRTYPVFSFACSANACKKALAVKISAGDTWG